MKMDEPPAAVDVLIVGCGYLGCRAAKLWIGQGRIVAALTRRRGDELRSLGIAPIVGNVLDPASLRHLPSAKTLLYAVGLDRSSGHSMREVYASGLNNVLTSPAEFGRILYISSTSVYGQTDDNWVDESSAMAPLEESGRIVLEAENALRAHRPDAIVLRFAGIYGPGRLLRQQAILRGESLGGDPEKWLNLIHVDDGAAAVLAAEQKAMPGELFNVADGEPVRRRDFYARLAELLNAPAIRFDDMQSSRQTHRRIGNQQIRNRLGVSLRYQSYREGLPSAVAAESGS
jgi:nucleoside-diphosphate-sugar epimerase